MEKILKEEKGITLVALVVTIIVLIILAGVSINLVLGENGIIAKAKLAKTESEKAKINEEELLNSAVDYIEQLGENEDQKNKIIYVGELNEATSNTGVVSSTFDIKNVYDDYQKLTTHNFVFSIDYLYDHWNRNVGITAGQVMDYSYNAETGILTINNAYQADSFNAGFYGSVYLVPSITELEKYNMVYVGKLNEAIGNDGAVTSSFDVKNIYANYQNLTIQNFVFSIEGLYDHWNTNVGITAGQVMNYSYNAQTGILTITNAFQVNSFNSGFYGSVYLVSNMNEIEENG